MDHVYRPPHLYAQVESIQDWHPLYAWLIDLSTAEFELTTSPWSLGLGSSSIALTATHWTVTCGGWTVSAGTTVDSTEPRASREFVARVGYGGGLNG